MVMPMGSFGMGGSGNVYQNLRARYSCGYIDNAERPKVAGYPLEVLPETHVTVRPKSLLGRWIDKLFN